MGDYYVGDLPAWKLAEGLAQVVEQLFLNDYIQLVIYTNVGDFSCSTDRIQGKQLRENNVFQKFLADAKSREYVIANHNSNLTIFSPQGNQSTINYFQPSNNGVAQFKVSVSHIQELGVTDALSKYFHLTTLNEVRLNGLKEVEKEIIQAKINTVTQLETTVARLGQYLTDAAQNERSEMSVYRKELDAEYTKRQKASEEQYVKQTSELAAKQAEFDKQKAEFDTNARTYVRRNLDKQLAQVLEGYSQITVQEPISRLRILIHIICSIVLIASGAYAGFIGYRAVSTDKLDWFHIVPFSASAITFGSTLIFYLKWHNAWFAKLAAAEFAHRKARFDIARAAWLAELLFEWKETKAIGLPKELLESLSTNLFIDPQQENVDHHPMDSIASAFKQIKSLKVGELEIQQNNRRGMKGQ